MISDWNSQGAVALGTLAAAVALVLGGCTSPDPEEVYNSQVAQFDVGEIDFETSEGCMTGPFDFSGTYFFAFATSIRPELPIYFEATINVADDLSVFDISLQPLSYDEFDGTANPTPRQPVGVVRDVYGVPISTDGTFEITIDGWDIPGAGNPVTGGDLSADVVMTGSACNHDHFCGTGSGSVIGTPLDGSTFGAILIADGADIVTMDVVDACIDFSDDDTGTDTDTGPDPVLEDQCVNPADLAVINGEVSVSGLAADCGIYAAGDPATAIDVTIDCMQNGARLDDDNPDNDIHGVDISTGCATCYANTVDCSINNCFLPCLNDPQGEECSTCQVEAGCIDDFEVCYGEEPLFDQCNNLSDHELVEAPLPDVSGLAGDCGLAVLAHPETARENTIDCMVNGLADRELEGIPISEGCASCYADTVLCSINNCVPACLDPSSEACATCQQEEGCIDAFLACYGEAPTALCNDLDLDAIMSDGFTPPDETELNTCAAACDGVEMPIDDCVDACIAASADATGLTFICTSCYMDYALCTDGDCDANFAACTAAPE